MKIITRTNQFKREFKLMLKRKKNQEKFTEVLEFLVSEKELPFKYRDHKLTGDYIGSRELHIEPDWLLIYKNSAAELILERTGSHSDLFKK